MATIELRLERAEAAQTADDIEAVLDSMAAGVVDCCSGSLERLLVDLLEGVEALLPEASVRSAAARRRPGRDDASS
jgi:hypothetical protein